MVAAALKRVLKVGEQAAQNRDLKALRCFRVKSKDEIGQDIIRWIFARGLVDCPRSQDTGTSTGSPAGRVCSQNQGGQAGATAGLWDSTHQHQEPEENPQTQGPDRGRGRRGGLITHYFARREGNRPAVPAPWQRVGHLDIAESDSAAEFNMIYLLSGDQRHVSDGDSQLSWERVMRMSNFLVWRVCFSNERCEGK